MSFSYEKLTENCIFHLLEANQHRRLYIDREFSAEKTRIGENIVTSFIFHFFTACWHTYAVLLAAAIKSRRNSRPQHSLRPGTVLSRYSTRRLFS